MTERQYREIQLQKFMDILIASAVRQTTDQGTVTEKPRVFVSHDDGAGERSTKVDIVHDSNTKFESCLGNAISSFRKDNSSELGCGLGYLGSVVKEHYGDEAQRHNKLPVWLIDHATAFANVSYRLVDSLKMLEESPAQKLKRLVLGKIAQTLRNAGALYLTKLKFVHNMFITSLNLEHHLGTKRCLGNFVNSRVKFEN